MELLPATIQEVARALGCRNRAARHHLMKLVDGGAVQFGGRPMRFRPMPGAVYDDQSVTEKARAAMDAALLAAMPGTVCAIAAAADVNHNTARSAMARLAARGQCVVTKQRPLTYARWNDEN
jgi:predicted ArsR family transcriptional regulator